MAQSYEDWIATCEDTDGIRFSWNNLPTSRVEAARMVRCGSKAGEGRRARAKARLRRRPRQLPEALARPRG